MSQRHGRVTISKVDTENTQTDNSNSGMYDDGSSEQKASKYNFYVQLTGTGDMLLGQHVYVRISDRRR